MQKNTDIRNELMEISPVLAEISNGNVYQVPPGYFDTLGNLLMNHIKAVTFSATAQTVEDTPVLPVNFTKAPVFTAPEGYFEGFAEKMMARIKASETESVSEELAGIAPILIGIDKRMPFTIPAGYFNALADNLAKGSKTGDLQEIQYSVLEGLKNINVYETPAGYFEGMADRMLAVVKQPQQQAKVISINKKSNWFKYAAAAVVIGVIATSGLLFFNKHASGNNNDPIGLSMVSDQEMLNYLDNQSTPAISTDSTANSVAATDINETDAKDLLSDIPDDELQQYLKDQVNAKDLIIN